jgi:hypothetical protein
MRLPGTTHIGDQPQLDHPAHLRDDLGAVARVQQANQQRGIVLPARIDLGHGDVEKRA